MVCLMQSDVGSKRFDASRAHVLDAPERLVWLPPAEVVASLLLEPTDVIADLGAGTGYFSLAMAAEATQGRIYAVDAQKEMLDLIEDKLSGQQASNVHLVHADAHKTGLADGSCSLVFMANVWHEFDDRSAVLHESLRILTRLGRIAILDWRPDVEREAGPPLDHRIDSKTAMAELAAAGLQAIAHRNIGLYSWLVQGTVL